MTFERFGNVAKNSWWILVEVHESSSVILKRLQALLENNFRGTRITSFGRDPESIPGLRVSAIAVRRLKNSLVV
jgi:hypothetical protein